MSDYMQGDKDNATAVPFSDDEAEQPKEAEDLLAEDSPDASPEERITRKQKRQARIQQLLADGKQSKEEAKALRDELSGMKSEMERMKGFLAASSQRQPPAQPAADPYQKELDAIYERQSNAYAAAQAEIKAGTWNAERQKYYEREARAIELAKARVVTRAELDQRVPALQQAQVRQTWESKYPEVYGNERAFAYAKATFERRKALGDAVTNDLVDEVMNDTLTTFKLGGKRAPSASEKAKLSGLPASGTGGGGGNKGAGITLTPELRRMAVARYSDLPEAEAIKKWVNGPGKKLRAQKVL